MERTENAVSNPDRRMLDSSRAFLFIALVMASGVVCILLFSFEAPNAGAAFSRAGVALLSGAASLMLGGLLGFLFGIPRAFRATLVRTLETTRPQSRGLNIKPTRT
jgi:hypothetical protein